MPKYNKIMDSQNTTFRKRIIDMTKNPMMSEFTGERIVERLTEKDLIKVNKIMKKYHTLNITTFLRVFRNTLKPTEEEDFYLTYGLFRLFQEICIATRKYEINFNDISSIVTEKMPSFNQQIRLTEKLYPLQFQVPDSIKKKIFAPQIIGKVMSQRERLQQNPYLYDKFIHLNRRVGQSFYSAKNKMFITIDSPSAEIRFLDSQFQLTRTIKTQLQISKRDAIISYLAWSQHQERLAAILGNYSISMWAKQDNYRFEVNVPLPISMLTTPYVMIGYLDSSKIWYAIDNRPTVYILSNYNFQPAHKFTHFKMIKQKETEKMMTVQLKYRKILCLAFEKNVFLINLEKRELVTQLRNFKTSVTSIVFSESYQALFVSNFQNSFTSYELSEHLDLSQKGKFQGHKHLISLIGVLEGRPVVYSIDQKSTIKLWDIRDFTCYQTFSVLKNVQYSQAIALPQGVCFVGSKHFCYRWKRFSAFSQAQNVVQIAQLQKNILIVTSKQLRLYNHSNGVLMRVVKGIFDNGIIIKAHLIEIRKLIVLMNDQGVTKIYSTKDFTQISAFNILPKPHFILYQKQTELITFSCMGEVRISDLKQLSELHLKRRIFNQKQMIKFCQVSPLHDLIAIQFEESPYLFFYSYEKAKLLGFLILQDLVTLKFMPTRNIIVVLCKDKILITTFKRNINSIVFFMKTFTQLWQQKDIKKYGINFNFRSYESIISTNLALFQNRIVITSNDACFNCTLLCSFDKIDSIQMKINREYYNPYRIATEDHHQSFDVGKPSVVIDQKINGLITQKLYFKHPGNRNYKLLSKINQFYCIADENEIIFYDQKSQRRGIINYRETLPLNWDLHNYSEEQFRELQFVLEFIQQQKPKEEDDSFLVTSTTLQKHNQLITMSMLMPNTEKQIKTFRSTSLRQKKMVLQKERDQRQKQQNYMQVRRGEQLLKLKNINKSSNQKYISQSLAFLNINRNKLLLSKGIPQIDLPQIRALQFKLNAAVNRDEKKSIVSKYSSPQDMSSPLRRITQDEITKSIVKTTTQLKLLHTSQQKESYKDQLKRLDVSLRQSKFKNTGRSGSLPSLRQI